MGSVGDCFDNAMAESFFATLECELLDRTHFHDHRVASSSSASNGAPLGLSSMQSKPLTDHGCVSAASYRGAG